MSATTSARPASARARRDVVAGSSSQRRKRMRHAWSKVLCVGATVIGLLFLASILFTLLWRGLGGPALTVFTDIDQAAGLEWRPAQRHRRQPDPDRARHRDRHADRPAGRHLSGRIRAGLGARQRGALRLRRAAVGAVDPDRPVHLRSSSSSPFGGFSGIAGGVALAVIVIPIVVRTTEDMLRLIPVGAARGGGGARRAEMEDRSC